MFLRTRVATLLLAFPLLTFGPLSVAAAEPIRGLFVNIDDSNFFLGPSIPDGQAGTRIDHYVDVLADSGTTVLLCNVNARRTNYRSAVWDAEWDGYDPKGPDDQPHLKPALKDDNGVPGYRQWIDNALRIHQQGVDYPARMLQRARQRGISPWITLRMNDCHCNHIPDHPFHGSFWRKNPQFARQNVTGYFATCLDYAHPEVRDFFMALIDEVLQRYDMDGLELDFMRECYLFSAGKEAEGAPILTAWMRDVRKRVQTEAARRGHPIRLSVRVPSRIETAEKWGLDVIHWAQEGLVDVLVVTPRWATLEFDMPLGQWRSRLGTAPVTLAGGLEVLYRPYPGGPATPATPELVHGAATMVWAAGADALYLFNYFPSNDPDVPQHDYQTLLKTMTSLETLLQQPRTVGITYRDVTAPGEAYKAPLPAVGGELVLSMRVGPLPPDDWHGQLLLGFAVVKDETFVAPLVQVNGRPCELAQDGTNQDGQRVLRFSLPLSHLQGTEAQQIQVRAPDGKAEYRVVRAEVGFRPDLQ